jgi:diaminopimelate epimerase
MHKINKTTSNFVNLPVEGGVLELRFREDNGIYKDVWLKGPAKYVYEGSFEVL